MPLNLGVVISDDGRLWFEGLVDGLSQMNGVQLLICMLCPPAFYPEMLRLCLAACCPTAVQQFAQQQSNSWANLSAIATVAAYLGLQPLALS